MKFLITGGAGFLGDRLTHALPARCVLGGGTIDEPVLADVAAVRADLLADPRVERAPAPC